MKKHYLFIIFVLFVFGCSESGIPEEPFDNFCNWKVFWNDGSFSTLIKSPLNKDMIMDSSRSYCVKKGAKLNIVIKDDQNINDKKIIYLLRTVGEASMMGPAYIKYYICNEVTISVTTK